jgi:hypothetical protein
MMETVVDKIKLFNRTFQDELEKMDQLQRKLDKNDIEPDEALEMWEQRIEFMQFILRKNKGYITREQVYVKKTHKGRQVASR